MEVNYIVCKLLQHVAELLFIYLFISYPFATYIALG